MSDKEPKPGLERVNDRLQGLDTYIEGKMKRYSLLFAVNGGAFAIAKMFGEPNSARIVGSLTLQELAVGAVVFTILMGIDIFLWGHMMRTKFFAGTLVFGWPGKAILILLCILLIVGWLIAAFGAGRDSNIISPAKRAYVPPNKSLQRMPGSGSSSAARFTSLGPAWLSSGR
jgi:hypothetical protein